MLRTIAYILAGIITVAAIVAIAGIKRFNNRWFRDRPIHLEIYTEKKPIDLVWNAALSEGYLEEHYAVSIPVSLENSAHHFQFQFDTGTPHSFVYSRSMESLLALGHPLQILEQDGERFVKELQCNLGGNIATLKMIKILENYGRHFTESDTSQNYKLGSIGSDILENKITEIDFKRMQLRFHNSRPSKFQTLGNFSPFSFKGRRIMLPVKIKNRNYELLYDTGCSSFGLITSKNRFNRYTAKDSMELKVGGNRFGETLPIVHKNTEFQMEISKVHLPLVRISYIDMYAGFQRFVTPFTKIGGFVGNKPFLDANIILDMQQEEFSIVVGGEMP